MAPVCQERCWPHLRSGKGTRDDLLAVCIIKRPQIPNLLTYSDIYELGQKVQDHWRKREKGAWGTRSMSSAWWSWMCQALTLHVRRRVHTFFLSGSRTPQCLSRSHSLSEDTERGKLSYVNKIYLASILLAHSLYYQIYPFVLTGGHFVVGPWDPVTWHRRGQRGVLPLALGWGPVTGWRSAR